MLCRRSILFLLCACGWVAPVSAQIGGGGWTLQNPLSFHVQWPYNEPEGSNYTVANGVYHMLIYNTNASFESTSTTLPRSEQRFDPDYTSGAIHYQVQMMVPTDTSAACIFQIHTGDAQEATFGSTTFMLFWYSTDGGSVHDYSGKELVKNLSGQWFQVNADHNLNTRTITIWINGNEVWQQLDNGSGDFYLKDGIYMQNGGSFIMENYVKNISVWTSPGRAFPGFCEIQNASSSLALGVRGAALTNGAAVVQSSFTNAANSLWYFAPATNGYYRIMNVNSYLAATVFAASSASGALIVQAPYQNGGSADWLLQQNTNTYTYTIRNRLSGLLLEDPNSSTSQNLQLDQKTANAGANQNWLLIPCGNLNSNLTVPPLITGTNLAHKLPFQLSGILGVSVPASQAATNLTVPINWQTIFTSNADTNGNWNFTDTNTAMRPARFYRAAAP